MLRPVGHRSLRVFSARRATNLCRWCQPPDRRQRGGLARRATHREGFDCLSAQNQSSSPGLQSTLLPFQHGPDSGLKFLSPEVQLHITHQAQWDTAMYRPPGLKTWLAEFPVVDTTGIDVAPSGLKRRRRSDELFNGKPEATVNLD